MKDIGLELYDAEVFSEKYQISTSIEHCKNISHDTL